MQHELLLKSTGKIVQDVLISQYFKLTDFDWIESV